MATDQLDDDLAAILGLDTPAAIARRRRLRRGGVAAVLVAVAAGSGVVLHDRIAPPPVPAIEVTSDRWAPPPRARPERPREAAEGTRTAPPPRMAEPARNTVAVAMQASPETTPPSRSAAVVNRAPIRVATAQRHPVPNVAPSNGRATMAAAKPAGTLAVDAAALASDGDAVPDAAADRPASLALAQTPPPAPEVEPLVSSETSARASKRRRPALESLDTIRLLRRQ